MYVYACVVCVCVRGVCVCVRVCLGVLRLCPSCALHARILRVLAETDAHTERERERERESTVHIRTKRE